MKNNSIDRRKFIKGGVSLAATVSTLALSSTEGCASPSGSIEDDINVVGPKAGFSPHIGTLYSMMVWMRSAILDPVQGLTTEQLDYLHDEKSNSIGSMLFHLAATERFYQIHTFEGKKWDDWPAADKERFGIASELGEEARKKIKGNNLNFYLDILKEVRENTITSFKKLDDNWLLKVDKDWFWGPTNNYCKWFHVCEHESNHNGQIKYIKSRIPGMK